MAEPTTDTAARAAKATVKRAAKPGAVPQGFAEGRQRRQHDRLELGKAVTIHEIGAFDAIGPGLEGLAVDVSRSGMGISTRRMMHMDRAVVVLMPNADGTCRAFHGKVRYSAYKEGGRYHVGVQFCAGSGAASVQAWLRQRRAV
ncbi:MAG: PilZ domain-containing protein [Phycisphaerales bacterium]